MNLRGCLLILSDPEGLGIRFLWTRVELRQDPLKCLQRQARRVCHLAARRQHLPDFSGERTEPGLSLFQGPEQLLSLRPQEGGQLRRHLAEAIGGGGELCRVRH
jgi:hypothetical protein